MNTRTDSPAPAPDRPEDLYPAVRHVASAFARTRPVTAEDMEQVGMAELLKRWHKFDPARSSRKSWAETVAKQGMFNAMRRGESDLLVYLPRTALARGVAYPKYVRLRRSDRYAGHGCDPSDPERRPILEDHRRPYPAPLDPRDFMAEAAALAGRALNRPERAVVLLYFARGMTLLETGHHMGYSESGVCLVVARFLAACRQNAGMPSRLPEPTATQEKS